MTSYIHLLGKTKKEIIQEMGNECNHHPAPVWTYQLKRSWLGRKRVLVLYFSEELVEHFEIRYSWK
ncbi:hypothetical protein [uncultured Chryseobacterium sp.]|uniref:hypothetical protein n=1 Tax=uncultured Chryseobacterium sp. TaxID=259322 RepID=UPI0025E01D92|nr:hypothetical protein [uncultured Chryseobacterium sp.]